MDIKHTYYTIRGWLIYRFTKGWWKLFKETLASYPYDDSYLLRLERAKIKEMIAYHEKTQRFVGVEYAIRDMKLAVALLNIVLEDTEKQLFHFEGDINFEDTGDGETYEMVPTEKFKYICDVKVNTKNIDRFVPDKKIQEHYLHMQHDLYIQKAKELYYKLRLEKTDEWWD